MERQKGLSWQRKAFYAAAMGGTLAISAALPHQAEAQHSHDFTDEHCAADRTRLHLGKHGVPQADATIDFPWAKNVLERSTTDMRCVWPDQVDKAHPFTSGPYKGKYPYIPSATRYSNLAKAGERGHYVVSFHDDLGAMVGSQEDELIAKHNGNPHVLEGGYTLVRRDGYVYAYRIFDAEKFYNPSDQTIANFLMQPSKGSEMNTITCYPTYDDKYRIITRAHLMWRAREKSFSFPRIKAHK